MNNDKTYFTVILIYTQNYVAGSGIRVSNLNLRTILGSIYDKYNAFNIKLESISPSFNNTNITVSCLHLSGLQWINGYDSFAPNYTNSRVLDIISRSGTTNVESNTNYISNANAIGFYKPSQFNVTLNFFWTDIDGVFFDRPLASFGECPFILSITGIDAYKILHPSKGLRYEYQNNLSSIFTLRYYDGVSIDPIDSTATKGRIRQFNNVNFRQMIGSEIYDKYNKFALITRRIFYNVISGTNFGTGTIAYQYYMSGNRLRFENPAYTTQTILTINQTLHYNNPILIGYSGISNNDFYLQYVFDKPSGDTSDIIIQYSNIHNINYASANTTNNDLFPNVIFQFEIIPIKI